MRWIARFFIILSSIGLLIELFDLFDHPFIKPILSWNDGSGVIVCLVLSAILASIFRKGTDKDEAKSEKLPNAAPNNEGVAVDANDGCMSVLFPKPNPPQMDTSGREVTDDRKAIINVTGDSNIIWIRTGETRSKNRTWYFDSSRGAHGVRIPLGTEIILRLQNDDNRIFVSRYLRDYVTTSDYGEGNIVVYF